MRVSEVFVECAGKTGFAGFGFFRQDDNCALRGEDGSQRGKCNTPDQRMAAGCILTDIREPKWKSRPIIDGRRRFGSDFTREIQTATQSSPRLRTGFFRSRLLAMKSLRTSLIVFLLASALPTVSVAASNISPGAKVYIEKMDGFEIYLAAAFSKKKVQLVVIADKDQADYIIAGTSEDKKAGWAKIVFMGNIHSDAAASVLMTDKKTGEVVFAYAVNKKSTMHGQQTTAEACAKHLEAHMRGKE